MWHLLVQTSMQPRQCRPPRRYRDEELVHGSSDERPPPPPPPLHPPPPQYMHDLRLFWDALLAVATRPVQHAPVVGCSFVHFSKHNSPDFYVDEGSIVADDLAYLS
jgi:hypothetical protein